MDDRDVLNTIDELADEERRLRDGAEGRPLSDEERGQLAGIEERRDQAWDLLRQRRARRSSARIPSRCASGRRARSRFFFLIPAVGGDPRSDVDRPAAARRLVSSGFGLRTAACRSRWSTCSSRPVPRRSDR